MELYLEGSSLNSLPFMIAPHNWRSRIHWAKLTDISGVVPAARILEAVSTF